MKRQQIQKWLRIVLGLHIASTYIDDKWRHIYLIFIGIMNNAGNPTKPNIVGTLGQRVYTCLLNHFQTWQKSMMTTTEFTLCLSSDQWNTSIPRRNLMVCVVMSSSPRQSKRVDLDTMMQSRGQVEKMCEPFRRSQTNTWWVSACKSQYLLMRSNGRQSNVM